jgi:hypothetical protein
MDSDSLQVSIALTIENAELYTTLSNSVKLATQGVLNLLYVSTYNCFILQINDFRYSLCENIPILVSRNEQNAIRSYVLPNMSSYYIIKVTSVSCLQTLESLETIFKKHSRLAYKDQDETNDTDMNNDIMDLDDVLVGIEDEKPSDKEKKSKKMSSPTSTKEGKTAKKCSIFSSLFCKSSKKDLQRKYEEKNQEPKTYNNGTTTLKALGVTTEIVSAMNKEYIQALIMSAKTIGHEISKTLEEHSHVVKRASSKDVDMLRLIEDTKLNGSAKIYTGMDEALSMISNSWVSMGKNSIDRRCH